MANQQTIAREATCRGVGLHSGVPVSVVLSPAPRDHGVVFATRGESGAVSIPAQVDSIDTTRNATILACNGARVGTVEHLLAALSAYGIDNVRVEVKGPEVPAMDGSSQPFAEVLQRAGARALKGPRPFVEVLKCVEIRSADRWIRIEPASTYAVDYTIDFDHPAIGRQQICFESITSEVFREQLAPARTFGFLEDVRALREAGLAKGGSFENTVVLGAEGVLNPGGLRFPDEFVRHKVVDLLGDLSLLGGWVKGRVTVRRGGHSLHRALAEALRDDPGAFRRCSESPSLGARG
uniref:UDP-3-O-acyl-N-acetylglucosamine deacetylase n=1 Tax=uncultured myxobacterium HF0200_01L06 TaxID=723556 RepID=E7C3H0_9BACT|nr:UDP-3-O-acyl-N-acetylglucosamine deacetylase [uncultured myxobacterium HF0200_01L06]